MDWRAAVGKVVWIPEEHRDPTVPAGVARRMLRCSEVSFAQLLDLGLPATPGPDGPRYDAFDLKNVALYSGTGGTEVEIAMRFLLAFMRSGRAALTAPRRWSFTLRLEPDGGGPRRVFRPAPEAFGGSLDACATDHGGAPELDERYVVLPPGATLAGTMTTTGADDPVRSAAIRAAVGEVVGSGVRWHYLPDAFATEADRAYAMGAGNCAVLGAVLRDRLLAAGFAAEAHHGWMIAASQVDHGWVDVVDEDGRVKCLDPSFLLLAVANGFGTADFADLVTGGRLNQVVPTAARVGEPFADGVVTFGCRPAPAGVA